MRANELRIGNYITGIYSDYEDDDLEDRCRVLALDETGELLEHKIWVESQKSNAEYFSEFKPILLTDEWFIKSGLEKVNNEWELKRYNIYKPVDYVNYLFCEGSLILREIKYVHTLQNLYFALIGEELEIK